jgi:predicted nucleotide-binding protein
MEKHKTYTNTRFSEDVLRMAVSAFRAQVPLKEKETEHQYFTAAVDGAEWKHDSEEEFFADFRRSVTAAVFLIERNGGKLRLQTIGTTIMVQVGATSRSTVESISSVFEQAAERCAVPPPPKPPAPRPVPPTIFIGHGRSPLWRDLKDHLHEKHHYPVAAYEIGARAGHSIRDVLQGMLSKSAFALLVMTGEDVTANGEVRARQNVVHETGLFQGRLGFRRAIVLLEEGTEEFSNLQGIDQIRFSKGNIKETYGEVVATIRREFPGAA